MKQINRSLIRIMDDQKGAVLVFIAVLIIIFLAFVALAIDIGHLYVVKNELQNAADAGALAGAQVLYSSDGQKINEGANAIAGQTAIANVSDKLAVEVDWSGENGPDVQRGHWQFNSASGTGVFTANSSTTPVALWDYTTAQLNNNNDFINAVQVVAHRDATPAISFFARLLGFSGFKVSAKAVAYIGFAGSLTPHSVDVPIAICWNSILVNGAYSCQKGRMISSGQTGGWTDFNQVGNVCSGTNKPAVEGLFNQGGPTCDAWNPWTLMLGTDMSTTNGEVTPAWSALLSCWSNATGNGSTIWQRTFPVIECPDQGSAITTCGPIVGAVTINILRMIDTENAKDFPNQAAGWTCTVGASPHCTSCSDGESRWDCFVEHFNLRDNVTNDLLLDAKKNYQKKSILMQPDCTPHIPTGGTGGQNFGILARTPVLVN